MMNETSVHILLIRIRPKIKEKNVCIHIFCISMFENDFCKSMQSDIIHFFKEANKSSKN